MSDKPYPNADMRAQIAALGVNQSDLARWMQQLGDDRGFKNILRSIQRMLAADYRVSGEMRALLGALAEIKRLGGHVAATPRVRPSAEHQTASP